VFRRKMACGVIDVEGGLDTRVCGDLLDATAIAIIGEPRIAVTRAGGIEEAILRVVSQRPGSVEGLIPRGIVTRPDDTIRRFVDRGLCDELMNIGKAKTR